MHITRRVGGEVQRQATKRLREHFAEPVPVLAQPLRTQPLEDAFDEMEEQDRDLRRRRAEPM